MKDFRLLFSALLRQNFRFDKSKIKTQKKWSVFLLYGIVAICCLPFLALVAYLLYQVGVLAAQLDVKASFLACIFSIIQLIVLMFGIATVLNTIYFSKDNEMLLAYPIKPQTIFASKLLFAYVVELIGSFALAVFMVIPFAIGASMPFSIGMILSFFILPVLPLFFATIVAIPFMYALSFFKNKSILSTIVLIVIATALFVVYFLVINSTSMMEESADMTQIILSLVDKINLVANIMLPNKLLALSMIGGSFFAASLNFLLALLIDLGLFALAYVVSSLVYRRSVSKQLETPKSSAGKKQKYQTTNKIWAFIKKDIFEIIRYPALAFYCLFELVLGPVLLIILGLNFSSTINVDVQELGMSFADLMALAPDLVALVLICMMTFIVFSTNYTATSAFSRENHNFYLLKVLPISYQKIVDAKALLAFIVDEIGVVVMLVLAYFFLHVPFVSIVISLIVCTAIALVFSYVQVYLDMRNPRLGWDNISAGLKNNSSSLFSLLLAAVALVILIGLYLLFSLAQIAIMIYIYYVVICLIAIVAFLVARGIAIKNATYIIENTNI